MFERTQNSDVFTAILATFAILLATKWIYRNYKLPPGPWLVPVVGGLRLLASQVPTKLFRTLRKKYGDIFCIKAGSQVFVVLNGYDTLKEALVKRADDFSDRAENFLDTVLVKQRGILGSSGLHWKRTRTFVISALREFGFGKKSFESKIKEEVDIFTEKIGQEEGKAFDITELVHVSVSNVICSIVFGKRFDYDDKEFKWLLSQIDFRRRKPTGVLNTFPVLRILPGDLFGIKSVVDGLKEAIGYFLTSIAKHRQTFDEQGIRDFIDAFIDEQRKHEKEDRVFKDDNFQFVILNLFAAGTETTSTTIRWTILYLLRNPKVQERMFKEIEDVVGLSRTPTIADRPNMPYCEAVIAEVLRISNIVPLSVPHGATKDFEFKGYLIPRGAQIIPNLDSVLHDPKLFPNPDKFDPERFLNSDGTFNGAKKVVAFSLGRRVCLGEALARMELFLFLTSLFQRFQMLPEDDNNLPPEEGIFGITYGPKPYKFKAVHRK